MYNADQTLIDRLNSNIQTAANNNDPRPQVYITRNKTAITSQRYWERVMLTTDVGTRSSVAIRRPEGSLLADMIFVAQVVGGNAVIQYAQPRSNLADMTWETLTTIPNVSELSIMFDGYMKRVDDKVEAYTVGDVPYVFFVDSGGSLKARNLDSNTADVTISDNAVNVASVRGLYSEAAGLDDGIWVFYTNSSGQLWEARFLGGEVIELTQVTLKPEGVTAWEDVWAGLSFDYRILLQLKGNDGIVYTLPSKSRPGGYSNMEYLRVSRFKVTGAIGRIPPVPITVENVSYLGNWGRRIRIVFDGDVFNVMSAELITELYLIEDPYGTRIYPVAVMHGASNNELIVEFDDFNQIIVPATLRYSGSALMGIDLPVEAFEIVPNMRNLNRHGGREYIEVTDFAVSGQLLKKQDDDKGYMAEHVEVTAFTVAGSIVEITYNSCYATEHVEVTAFTVAGTYADASGVPIG